MKPINVLMVGVGGQGVVLASDGLAEIGMKAGYDVKKTDSIGMAQRGGSVVSHIRWGEKVFSPMTKKGEVDFLVAFEELEAARWAPYLRPGGVALVADVAIMPVSALGGKIPYPSWEQIAGYLDLVTERVHRIPARRIGEEVKNTKALNIVMMGALSTFLDLDPGLWLEDIRRRVPPKFLDSSLAAFRKGAEVMKEQESGR